MAIQCLCLSGGGGWGGCPICVCVGGGVDGYVGVHLSARPLQAVAVKELRPCFLLVTSSWCFWSAPQDSELQSSMGSERKLFVVYTVC